MYYRNSFNNEYLKREALVIVLEKSDFLGNHIACSSGVSRC